MKLTHFIALAVIIVACSYLMNLLNTISHEDIHQKIFDDYNIPSNITINYWTGSGYTDAHYNTSACNEMCHYQHNMNEIVGYPMTFLINTIFLALILILAIIYVKDAGEVIENEKHRRR